MLKEYQDGVEEFKYFSTRNLEDKKNTICHCKKMLQSCSTNVVGRTRPLDDSWYGEFIKKLVFPCREGYSLGMITLGFLQSYVYIVS